MLLHINKTIELLPDAKNLEIVKTRKDIDMSFLVDKDQFNINIHYISSDIDMLINGSNPTIKFDLRINDFQMVYGSIHNKPELMALKHLITSIEGFCDGEKRAKISSTYNKYFM